MIEHYQIPAFALTLLLLPSLAYVAMRFQDRRALLWFFGFLLALVRMAQHYNSLVFWNFSNEHQHPWLAAVGIAAIPGGSVPFVMSLSRARMYIGRFRIPLAVLFLLPVVTYVVLYVGVLRQGTLPSPYPIVLPVLAACSCAVALVWALKLDERRRVPRAIIPIFCVFMIVRAGYIYVHFGP